MRRLAVAVCGLALLGGCNQLPAGGAAASQSGRYQVVQAADRTILLDTREGRAWELLKDANGGARGWAQIQSL